MPIYEYRCQSCGHELEKLQRLSDPVLTDCPDCGKAELRRLISAAGFRLKGAGWYETDFKQSNQRNLADSPGDKGDRSARTDSSDNAANSAPKSDSKSDSKTDSKADSKSDSKSNSKTGSQTGAKSEAKSDSKPASKPDSGASKSKGGGAAESA